MRCMCHTKRICCACAIYSSASGAQSKPHAQRMHHICYICTSCVTQSESCMQCMCYIKQCIWRSKHIMYLRIHHKKWSLSHACTACDAQSKSCTHCMHLCIPPMYTIVCVFVSCMHCMWCTMREIHVRSVCTTSR